MPAHPQNPCHAEAMPKHLRTDLTANLTLLRRFPRCARNDNVVVQRNNENMRKPKNKVSLLLEEK